MHRLAQLAIAAALSVAATASPAAGQSTAPAQPAASALPADSLVVFVKAYAAVAQIREKAQAEMAEPKNKKPEEQERIKVKLRGDVATALRTHGFTADRFDALTRLVSTDDAARKAFEGELARQAGGARP